MSYPSDAELVRRNHVSDQQDVPPAVEHSATGICTLAPDRPRADVGVCRACIERGLFDAPMPPETVRVVTYWTETVLMEGVRELDAGQLRALGYDPADPASIQKYLEDAYYFEGDKWYPWHEEFANVGKRIDSDEASIQSVKILPS